MRRRVRADGHNQHGAGENTMSMVRFGFASLLLVASAAFGGSPQENHDRLWNKYATDFFDPKPKVACVCFDGVNNYRLGTVIRSGPTFAACYMTSFDGNGDFVSQSPCNGPFSTLAR